MAEAASCPGDNAASSAQSSQDSKKMVVVEPPNLEDLAEEEDVFLPERGQVGLALGTEKCPGYGAMKVEQGTEEDREKQMENQFLYLAIRKQVSYSCMFLFAVLENNSIGKASIMQHFPVPGINGIIERLGAHAF
ncbi:hypothetical protein EOD39_12200 [Acipenser ruthenus]|uniref:Uncharacterized protein n=1 Tax=Acipenser ruthenus TaxID=7906 RepID=A0A444ULX6_ACIRT|nr:hypothetical protein EOD39_12200 [Acipenser ruthenus]